MGTWLFSRRLLEAHHSSLQVTNREILGDQTRPRLFQFGHPGAIFDFALTPPGRCYPRNGRDRPYCLSSFDRNSPTNGYQTLSPSSDSSDGSFFSRGLTPPSSVTFHSQDSCSNSWQTTPSATGGNKATDVSTDPDDYNPSVVEPYDESTTSEPSATEQDPSLANPTFFEPHVTQGGAAPPRNVCPLSMWPLLCT